MENKKVDYNNVNDFELQYSLIIEKVTKYKKTSDTPTNSELYKMICVIADDINHWYTAYKKKKVYLHEVYEAVISFEEYLDSLILTIKYEE